MAGDGGGIGIGTFIDDVPIVKGVQNIVASMGGLASAVTLVGAALTTMGLVEATQEAMKFELQVAELAKLVGQAQAEPLSQSIAVLANELPVARDRLFEVAETAARLGIRGTQNVSEFTQVVAEIGVATDATADEAAESMARLAKITQTPIGQIRNLASAMNEASNTMAVSFTDVMDASLRSAAGLKTMGAQAPGIVALAASAAELSASSRRAGTRLNRLASEIQTAPVDELASTIGLTRDELNKLRDERPEEIIIRLAEAMRGAGEETKAINKLFGEASLKVLRALSINYEEARDNLTKLNTAFQDGTSIGEEYSRFASTAQSESVRLRNKINDLQAEVGEDFLPIWKDLLQTTNDIIGAFNRLTRTPLEEFLPQEEVENFRDELQKFTIGGQIKRFEEDLQLIGGMPSVLEGMAITGVFSPFDKTDEMARSITRLAGNINNELRPAFFANVEVIAQNADSVEEFNNKITRMGLKMARTTTNVHEFRDSFDVLRKTAGVSAEQVDKWNSRVVNIRRRLPFQEVHKFEGQVTETNRAIRQGNMSFEEANEWLTDLAEGYGVLREETGGTAEETITLAQAREEERLKSEDTLENLEKLVELRREELRQARASGEGVPQATRAVARAEAAAVEAFRDRVTESVEDIHERVESGREKMEEGLVQSNRLVQLLSTVDFSIDPRSEIGQEQVMFIIETLQAVENLDHALSLLPPSFREAVEWYIEFTEGADEGGDALERFNERAADLKLETVESRMRLLSRVTEDLSDGFFDMFAALISGADDAEKKLTDMLKSISQMLAKRMLQGLIFSGLQELGVVESFADVEGKAKGGPVKPGQLTIVGEEGPEFFVPDGAGIVAPRLRNVGSPESKGDTVNINVSMSNEVRALDARGVKRVLDEQMPHIAQGVSEQVGRSMHMKRNFGR